MSHPKRHPAAASWALWAEANAKTCDPRGLGCNGDMEQYLVNRLHSAFMAGFKAGEQARGNEFAERFQELFLRPG